MPAEILKAGGDVLAIRLHSLLDRIVQSQQWPWRWQGARIARLWKKKGDCRACGNSTGLLISDHVSKVLPEFLKTNLVLHTERNRPATQSGGGVAGAGTGFIFYIDLSQAYDRVVREVVCGWPQPVPGATETATDSARIQYLESIGVSEHAAQHTVSNIRVNGTVLDRWNVCPVVRDLVRGVHSNAWFRVGGRETVVAASTGGRQGCKLGGLIFAVDDDDALKLTRSEMAADRNKPVLGIRMQFDTLYAG